MDWQAIIQDLRKVGVTQTEIARACGLSPQSIGELAQGIVKEPRHSVGDTILLMHSKRVVAPKLTTPAAEQPA